MDKYFAATHIGVPHRYGIGLSPAAEAVTVTVCGGPGGLQIGKGLEAGPMEKFYAFTGGAGAYVSKIPTTTHDTRADSGFESETMKTDD